MNIYMAAVFTNSYMKHQGRYRKLTDYEKSVTDGLLHILESWHYVGKQTFVDQMRRNNASIFLDSGAFSAYNLGVKLSVEKYCQYIKTNEDIIRRDDGVLMASVLDGIGDAQETYENQLKMEKLGVKPLPCFHAGEDEKYLEWYVQNYDYITLGGMVGSSTKQLEIWLDRMWDRYLTDGSGNPRLKVHGFGITSIRLMERYPWHSCDSSSWIQSAAFGTVITPQWGTLQVSEKSPSRHVAGQHVDTVSPVEQETILNTLEAQGFPYERLATIYESRAVYNLWAFTHINNTVDKNQSATLEIGDQELF